MNHNLLLTTKEAKVSTSRGNDVKGSDFHQEYIIVGKVSNYRIVTVICQHTNVVLWIFPFTCNNSIITCNNYVFPMETLGYMFHGL